MSGAKISASGNGTSGIESSLRGFLKKATLQLKVISPPCFGLKVTQAKQKFNISLPISKRANIERLYRDRVSFCGERKKKQKKTSFEDAGAKALKSHSRKVSHSKEQQRETKMTLSKQCMAPCAGHRNCRKQTKQ